MALKEAMISEAFWGNHTSDSNKGKYKGDYQITARYFICILPIIPQSP